MASQSSIEWTDATWNPVRARVIEIQNDGSGKERIGWHCEHVSEGCRNCYAEAINRRLGTGRDFKPGELYRPQHEGYRNGEVKLFLDEKLLTDPLRWKRPRSVFLSSMTDVFADFVSDDMLDRMFAVMALCPHHFFRVLTKRPERMRDYVNHAHTAARVTQQMFAVMRQRGTPITPATHPKLYDQDSFATPPVSWPLPNVGLGVSVEDQATADERIPHLLATPAAMRIVSAEPLLGAVDLGAFLRGCHECAQECGWRSGDAPLEEKCQWCGATGTDHAEFCKECGRQDFTGVCPRCGANTVHHHPDTPCLDEVIVGGESGKGARPMHPDWSRSLRDQCAKAGVSFFFKQWGEWAPNLRNGANIVRVEGDQGGWVAAWPDGTIGNGQASERGGNAVALVRGTKNQFAPLLDGVEHREVAPQVRAHFERLTVAAPPHPSAASGGSLPLPAGERDAGEAG